MISVLINAYAVSPSWGSEQGVGWNMVTRIARSCKVTVITEGEWKDEIETALADLPCRENLAFHYIPVSDRVRRMCWRQGDYRFYFHYMLWQRKALKLARTLMANSHFDVIHQLNMVGFREPGFLWKIKGVPYVWGPVGGMELMPLSFLWSGDKRMWWRSAVKNLMNVIQMNFHPRVIRAMRRADCVVSATRGCSRFIEAGYGIASEVINETGCERSSIPYVHTYRLGRLDLLWIGKFDTRKQLGLALEVLASLPPDIRMSVRLQVAGAGSVKETRKYQRMAQSLGIADAVTWCGKVPHDQVKELMRSSGALLFTSVMEATSTVVLEAVENNLPVMCFDTCGFGSVVDETIGYKIPLRNHDAAVADFASAIMCAMGHPEEMAAKSAACTERQERLSWDWKAQRYVEIYQSLI